MFSKIPLFNRKLIFIYVCIILITIIKALAAYAAIIQSNLINCANVLLYTFKNIPDFSLILKYTIN